MTRYVSSLEDLALVLVSPVRTSIVVNLEKGSMTYEQLYNAVNNDVKESKYFIGTSPCRKIDSSINP